MMIHSRVSGPPLALRRASWLAPLLALVALLLAACGDPTWREIIPPDGGFRIAMKREPRVEKQDIDTPLGKITGYWYAVEEKDAVYGIGYSDYPDAIFKHGTPRQLFPIVRDGWLKRINGTAQGNGTDIILDNRYPGMEVIASGQFAGEDAYMRARFYLVGTRLYQVIAFGKKSVMAQSDINQFLSSFKLVPRLDTTTVTIDAEPEMKKRAAAKTPGEVQKK